MNADTAEAAELLACEPRAVAAVAAVESSGAGFDAKTGKPVIRLEAHWFGKLTNYAHNATHPRISATDWDSKLAAGNQREAWEQFEAAAALNRGAAIQATSWGKFQIMGFHWKALGFDSPEDFAAAMETERGQLDAFVRFVAADPMLTDALRRKDWHTFASRYNGPGQVDTYAARMAAAYDRAAA